MPRADAQRNVDALLAAAKEEFAVHGVDANVRAVAARAGVGTATLYRHFPLRSDLIAAVFRREVDACAQEAPRLAAVHGPDEALELWLRRYTDFVATKRGLAAALHSGDPAFTGLRSYFEDRVGPALETLLRDAEAAGAVREGMDALDLLGAVSNLCAPASSADDTSRTYRMVGLLLDGLRYGAAGNVERAGRRAALEASSAWSPDSQPAPTNQAQAASAY